MKVLNITKTNMSKTKQAMPEQAEVDDSGYELIYPKLLAFQKLGISLSKDAKNPHFKNDYADLNETLRKIKKPLNDLGILIIQEVEETGLYTCLMCVQDGSEVSCFLPWIETGNAQKRGSEITYFRRYSLKTLLALDDDDDDANSASEEPAKKQTGKEKAAAYDQKNIDSFNNDVDPFSL